MNTYRFGFSIQGFVAFLLAMIPNVIWMIAPPSNNPIGINSTKYPLFDIIATISQVIMIALLIGLVPKKNRYHTRNRVYPLVATFCLVIYYILWFVYYTGMIHPWMIIGMAVFPSVYFVFIALWLKNYMAIIPGVVFGMAHIASTFLGFIQ